MWPIDLVSLLLSNLNSWLNIKDLHLDMIQGRSNPPISELFLSSCKATLNTFPEEDQINFPMTFSNFFTIVRVIGRMDAT